MMMSSSSSMMMKSMMSSELHFFSFLLDGTTDAGNIEDQFCRQDNTAKEMKSCARYFSIFNEIADTPMV